MPSNSTGKWVERAATTGGGRTYRGQMPVNWYATLALICIVGLLLVGFSRYQRTHPTSSSSGPPTTQQQWFAALGVDICGKMQPDLPASTNAGQSGQAGLVANGNGVLTIAPKDSSESGANATLGRFVSGYHGLQLTASTLQYPGQAVMTNGDVCPKGTPQAGKPGVVIVDSWPSFTSKSTGTETDGPPQDLKFANGQLITMAFVPATVTVPKPPAQAITNLITAVTSGSASPSASTPTPTPTTPTPTTPTPTTGGSGP
ncbi:MAG: hypothetical protein ACRDYE_03765 [Acidimicrobiales bacterium]